MKKQLLSVAIASGLSLGSVLLNPSYANSCEPLALGMNLPHAKYYNPAWMFVDLMKGSKPFESHNISDGKKTDAIKQISMDANGYPLALPAQVEGFSEAQYVGTVLGEIGLSVDKQERYTLYYDGVGDIRLGAVDIVDNSTAGQISFDFPKQKHIDQYLLTGKPKTSFTLSIKSSLAGDPIHNIRVMRPNFSTTDSEQSHPLFHQRLAGFSTLRFMGTLGINRSNHETVADITSTQQATQFNAISPYYVAKIANTNKSNAWINIPHRATDEYVRNFAQILKDELNPNAKVYVEYSNEVWNSLFQDKKTKEGELIASGQYTYLTTQGCADPSVAIGACQGDKIESKKNITRMRQYTKRSLEIFQIFDSVFSQEKQRAISVLAGQAGSTSKTSYILAALDDVNINPNAYQVDSFAIAPYFGGKFTRDMVMAQFNNTTMTMGSLGGEQVLASDITMDQFLDEMAYIITNEIPETIQKQKTLIDAKGMELIAYEGGQHIAALGARIRKWDENRNKIQGYEFSDTEKARWSNLFDAHVKFTGDVNRHARMKNLYKDYFKQWFDLGGKDFMAFSYIGANGAKSGSWGVLETQNQATEDAPKYAALRELLDENSCAINDTTIEVNGTVYPDGSNISVVPNQAISVKVSMNKANVTSFKHRIPARLRITWNDIANIQMDKNICKAVGNIYTIYRIECTNPPQGMSLNYSANMVSNLKTSSTYTVTEFANGDRETQKQYFVPVIPN